MISVMCEIVDNSNEKAYPFGRVYRLVSSNGLCYVGATVQSLKERFYTHEHPPASNCELKTRCLFENGAFVKIEQIEEVPNITLKGLQQLKEKYMIEHNVIQPFVENKEFDTWFNDNIIEVDKGRMQSSILLQLYNEHSRMRINSKMLIKLMSSKGIQCKKIGKMYFMGIIKK